MLKLAGVTKRFGARIVLNTVSLEVAPGEYVAVVGESGIGKSTLLHVIAGLEPADSGSVAFDGAEITRMDDDSATLLRRDRFGFVFQAFHVLPHLTVLQNVGLPLLLRGASREIARRRVARSASPAGRRATEGYRAASCGGWRSARWWRSGSLTDEPTGNRSENARQVLELLRAQVKRTARQESSRTRARLRLRPALPAFERRPRRAPEKGSVPTKCLFLLALSCAPPEADFGGVEISALVDREVVDPLELARHPAGAAEASDLHAVGAAQDVDPAVRAIGHVHEVLAGVVREHHVPNGALRERLHLDAEFVQELAVSSNTPDAIVDAITAYTLP